MRNKAKKPGSTQVTEGIISQIDATRVTPGDHVAPSLLNKRSLGQPPRTIYGGCQYFFVLQRLLRRVRFLPLSHTLQSHPISLHRVYFRTPPWQPLACSLPALSVLTQFSIIQPQGLQFFVPSLFSLLCRDPPTRTAWN